MKINIETWNSHDNEYNWIVNSNMYREFNSNDDDNKEIDIPENFLCSINSKDLLSWYNCINFFFVDKNTIPIQFYSLFFNSENWESELEDFIEQNINTNFSKEKIKIIIKNTKNNNKNKEDFDNIENIKGEFKEITNYNKTFIKIAGYLRGKLYTKDFEFFDFLFSLKKSLECRDIFIEYSKRDIIDPIFFRFIIYTCLKLNYDSLLEYLLKNTFNDEKLRNRICHYFNDLNSTSYRFFSYRSTFWDYSDSESDGEIDSNYAIKFKNSNEHVYNKKLISIILSINENLKFDIFRLAINNKNFEIADEYYEKEYIENDEKCSKYIIYDNYNEGYIYRLDTISYLINKGCTYNEEIFTIIKNIIFRLSNLEYKIGKSEYYFLNSIYDKMNEDYKNSIQKILDYQKKFFEK